MNKLNAHQVKSTAHSAASLFIVVCILFLAYQLAAAVLGDKAKAFAALTEKKQTVSALETDLKEKQERILESLSRLHADVSDLNAITQPAGQYAKLEQYREHLTALATENGLPVVSANPIAERIVTYDTPGVSIFETSISLSFPPEALMALNSTISEAPFPMTRIELIADQNDTSNSTLQMQIDLALVGAASASEEAAVDE